MSDLIAFLSTAPYLMIAAFFFTFTVTKIAQSEQVYRVVRGALDEKRHTKLQKILDEMQATERKFLRTLGTQDETTLKSKDRKVLEQIRASYYAELGSLYKKGEKNNE
jgi:hypothetical protein